MSEPAIGWRRSSLGEIARVRRGASPRPINDPKWFADEGPGWVRIADVSRAGRYLRKTEQRLSRLGLEKSVRVGPGDIIMSIAGTIGKPAIVDMDACIHDGFVLFSDLDSAVDREFLFYFLGWKAGEFNSRGQPGTQKNINTAIVGDTPIDLPPPSEQRKIAAILSSIDDRIERTETTARQIQSTKKALLGSLLSGGNGHRSRRRTALGDLPIDWDVFPLAEAGTWLSGGTPSKADPELWRGEIPWVSPKDMKIARLGDAEDHVSERAVGNGTRLVPGGTILMVVRGMILAHSFPVAVTTGTVAFNQDIKALIVRDELVPEFMLYWLQFQKETVLSVAASATHGTLRVPTEDLFRLCFPCPPKEQQRMVVEALTAVDSTASALVNEVEGLRKVKRALASSILSGEIRTPPSEVVA